MSEPSKPGRISPLPPEPHPKDPPTDFSMFSEAESGYDSGPSRQTAQGHIDIVSATGTQHITVNTTPDGSTGGPAVGKPKADGGKSKPKASSKPAPKAKAADKPKPTAKPAAKGSAAKGYATRKR